MPIRTSADDPLLDEAIDWVVRLKAGAPTRADLAAFLRWRRQSDAHAQALREVVGLYGIVAVAAKELADEETASLAPFTPRPSRRLGRRAVVVAGAIAAASGYIMVRPPFRLWPSIKELFADYRTGKGERRKVAVAPGVSLELNTQTSITVRSAPGETRIQLISGEVWVTAKTASSSKPFVMLSGDGNVTVSQGSFNERCLDKTVTVTCLDGSITVEQESTSIILQQSEQVTYSEKGLQPAVVVDLAQVSAWQVGLLVFRDRPLAAVVEEINRYRSGMIIISSDTLKRRLVNGTFQIDKLDNFVAQVRQLFGARITHLPGGVVFMS